jgi:hypothetical protein
VLQLAANPNRHARPWLSRETDPAATTAQTPTTALQDTSPKALTPAERGARAIAATSTKPARSNSENRKPWERTECHDSWFETRTKLDAQYWTTGLIVLAKRVRVCFL